MTYEHSNKTLQYTSKITQRIINTKNMFTFKVREDHATRANKRRKVFNGRRAPIGVTHDDIMHRMALAC